MKLKIFITITIVGIIAYAGYSANVKEAFAPAADFPRGALVYAQIADLPAFIRLWNESKLKGKYLASENYAELKNRHLGLKLASRWQEFNDAVGFPIDTETLAGLSETRAAIAVYDIGKLEFVFVAPISGEIFAATKFALNQSQYKEETLADETIIYTTNVEADRGRQKQKLQFAHVKGRFILATSEKLLLQTIANINGVTDKNRLSDEPDFKNLSEKVEPHLAAVWVNQAALNDDYYFKHYWLMPNPDELKNIRAGMFDFAMEEGKFVERRKFLLVRANNSNKIHPAEARKMLSLLPENVPFYRLQAANDNTASKAIFDTIYDRQSKKIENERSYYSHYSSDDFDDFGGQSYHSLSGKYDETIDDAEEIETADTTLESNEKARTDLRKILQSAAPQSILAFTRPQSLPMPLFARFQRAAIINLGSPAAFNREEFESALARSIKNRITISAPNTNTNWETKSENGLTRRELRLPMLDWGIGYAMRDGLLILSNDTDFLREILAAKIQHPDDKLELPLTELTVTHLDQRRNAYDRIFSELSDEKVAGDFFTGNIESLLDSISEVKKIEIKKSFSEKYLDEEVIINFNVNQE